jgi:hypothetical protein
VTAASGRRHRPLTLALRVSLAKRDLDELFDIRVHRCDRLGEALLVVTHVVPLSVWKLIGRVELPIDQRKRVLESPIERVVGNAQACDRFRAVGMVTRDVPCDRAPPVMSHPNRPFST